MQEIAHSCSCAVIEVAGLWSFARPFLTSSVEQHGTTGKIQGVGTVTAVSVETALSTSEAFNEVTT